MEILGQILQTAEFKILTQRRAFDQAREFPIQSNLLYLIML